MHPVTVPAASLPMSWHIDQLGLRHMSAHAAVSTISAAACPAFGTSAAPIKHKPASGMKTAPIDRPIFTPYVLTSRSVSHPPVMVAAPPVSSTALASIDA